jgi:hypothetical protein|nr:MAG TPA: hypothetical protein [Podoviridae sp. ctK5Q1]
MELLKPFISKNTRIGRAVRTALQVAIALFPAVLAVLNTPGLEQKLVDLGVLQAVGLFPVWAGAVSYAYNIVEHVYKDIKEEDK